MMILADKIMEERKKNGWSQEELAEQLGVSRQSVSKWESAQSVPDLTRILQMADLFGVTTDYLLKDNCEKKEDNVPLNEAVKTVKDVRTVSMEEASDYLIIQKRTAPIIAFAVSLCIMSPILLIVLAGLADGGMLGISENLACGLGLVVLLVMVAVAVFFFIQCGGEVKKYDYLENKNLETAYGVDGMVRDKKEAFSRQYNLYISVGVILCIISCIPLIAMSLITEKSYIIVAMVGVLLFIVAIAVNMFVRVGIINSSFDKLLQEGDYTQNKKKSATVIDRIAGIYWLIVTAVYLGWSFATNKWDISWVVWPVGGVLFAAVILIVKIVIKEES
ncbi:MAG: helix-turn-helix domain-containing protein [Lachnospira sp.]